MEINERTDTNLNIASLTDCQISIHAKSGIAYHGKLMGHNADCLILLDEEGEYYHIIDDKSIEGFTFSKDDSVSVFTPENVSDK